MLPHAKGQTGNECETLKASAPKHASSNNPGPPGSRGVLICLLARKPSWFLSEKMNVVSKAQIKIMKSVLFRGLCSGFGGCRWKVGTRRAKNTETEAIKYTLKGIVLVGENGCETLYFNVICLFPSQFERR